MSVERWYKHSITEKEVAQQFTLTDEKMNEITRFIGNTTELPCLPEFKYNPTRTSCDYCPIYCILFSGTWLFSIDLLVTTYLSLLRRRDRSVKGGKTVLRTDTRFSLRIGWNWKTAQTQKGYAEQNLLMAWRIPLFFCSYGDYCRIDNVNL